MKHLDASLSLWPWCTVCLLLVLFNGAAGISTRGVTSSAEPILRGLHADWNAADSFSRRMLRSTEQPADNAEQPQQGPVDLQAVVEQCYAYLRKHECKGNRWGMPFDFYRPALNKYSAHQWLWDSGAHMVAWSHRNVTNSIADIQTMLQLQQSNGMIPEMIFWGLEDEPWWKRLLETAWYSSSQHTDITQMPNLPFALRAIWRETHDVALMKEVVPKIAKYFDWWAATRDVDGNGLVAIIHGWESGIDASPAYDIAYGIDRSDVSLWNLYPRFMQLMLSYKWWYNWDFGQILSRKKAPNYSILDNWFIVTDVGVNSVYAAGWGLLGDLAASFDADLSRHCKSMQSKVEAAILQHCWSSQHQRFVSLYKDRNGRTLFAPVETVQSLLPLLLESLPLDKVNSIVNGQLLNSHKFWTAYPVPSTSRDAAQYNPGPSRLLWRGPVWPMMNWLVMEGLARHGQHDAANRLLDKWVNLYIMSGVWEQYNPETGEGFGAEGLGMSTLIVDWVYRLNRLPRPDTPGPFSNGADSL